MVWAAGTVMAPLASSLGHGFVVGMAVHESGGNNAIVAAGAAGGAIGGAALGILAVPLAGVAWAYCFVNGIDELFISDQSDEESTVIIEDR